MTEERFIKNYVNGLIYITDNLFDKGYCIICEGIGGDIDNIVVMLNEQQAIIDKQELRLQQLEELLELSENLNTSYREKLIDMNLKMVRLDAENEELVKKLREMQK